MQVESRLTGLSIILWIGLLVAVSAGQLSERRFAGSIEHPAIEYPTRPATDGVARVDRRLASGELELAAEPATRYLRAVLGALDVPLASQILVFKKTGVQAHLTSPGNPRAFYFNDSVVVGYVRGAPLIEVASLDPQQGVVFYTLAQDATAQVRLVRDNGCVSCHESLGSLDVPGMLVRSEFANADGRPLRQLGTFLIDHRTPFAQRWGGWYVTGTHGAMRHMGNATVSDLEHPESMITTDTLNLTSVAGRFDTTGYLSDQSDIVALLVFEHQMHAANLLVRVGWDARVAQFDQRLDVAGGPLREAIDELVDYFLFVDEAPLTAKVAGHAAFADGFSAAGPRDRRGRSLRDLDMTTRMMRYPCSYMIYSAAFDGLPAVVRDAIYRRLWVVLSGQDDAPRYARLSGEDRRAVIEILQETKPGLPDYYSSQGPKVPGD
ncbi:MAG: hypothetical protein ABIT71_14680 [Vicinamibacteraceae bacterium]